MTFPLALSIPGIRRWTVWLGENLWRCSAACPSFRRNCANYGRRSPGYRRGANRHPDPNSLATHGGSLIIRQDLFLPGAVFDSRANLQQQVVRLSPVNFHAAPQCIPRNRQGGRTVLSLLRGARSIGPSASGPGRLRSTPEPPELLRESPSETRPS